MVRVEASHLEDLRGVVAWEIQKLAKIRSTVTLIKKDPLKYGVGDRRRALRGSVHTAHAGRRGRGQEDGPTISEGSVCWSHLPRAPLTRSATPAPISPTTSAKNADFCASSWAQSTCTGGRLENSRSSPRTARTLWCPRRTGRRTRRAPRTRRRPARRRPRAAACRSFEDPRQGAQRSGVKSPMLERAASNRARVVWPLAMYDLQLTVQPRRDGPTDMLATYARRSRPETAAYVYERAPHSVKCSSILRPSPNRTSRLAPTPLRGPASAVHEDTPSAQPGHAGYVREGAPRRAGRLPHRHAPRHRAGVRPHARARGQLFLKALAASARAGGRHI